MKWIRAKLGKTFARAKVTKFQINRMNITAKEYAGYKKARLDPWAPSANDNYNLATWGITAEKYRQIDRIISDMYGIIRPRSLPSLAKINDF